MTEDLGPMAWAIFSREFNWHRPGSRFSFNAKASPCPQSRVHDFVEAAIAAGAAVRVRGNRKPPDTGQPADTTNSD